MPNLFISTRFNDYDGDLISMGIACDGGCKFYEVLDCPNPRPWVSAQVMPHLNNPPIPVLEFQVRLETFLRRFGFFTLYAVSTEDIARFCQVLNQIHVPTEFTIKFVTFDFERKPNALEDALSFRDTFLRDD